MRLYMWMCKYFKFPVDHPTIQMECVGERSMFVKEGVVRCTMLPTRDLYHRVPQIPVLNKRFILQQRALNRIW
jgi:hypothetical protein